MDPFVPTPGIILSNDIGDYPDGIVIPIDKPYRWTSADVIRKVKYAAIRHFGKKNLKVGHAGTLDPLATGLLLVCIGNATKLAQTLQDHDKEYLAGVMFGATTPSYDREKDIDRQFPFDSVTQQSVAEILPSFLGEQDQVAPLFSAKSVDGVRAYEMARKLYKQTGGSSLDSEAMSILHTSKITIHSLTLETFSPAACQTEAASLCHTEAPEQPSVSVSRASSRINVIGTSALALPVATIRIACSKGTYIRAFARDLGEALGSGAFLDSLIRTRTGSFTIEKALSLRQALEVIR